MALINCPECGIKISDSAKACPSCGFPYKEYISQFNFWKERKKEEEQEEKAKQIKMRAEKEAQLKKEQEELNEKRKRESIKCADCGKIIGDVDVCPYCGCDMLEYKKIQKEKEEKAQKIIADYKQAREQRKNSHRVDISSAPKCPKCGSTYIQTSARGIDGFWLNIGASKTVNRCSHCGYTWTPRIKR